MTQSQIELLKLEEQRRHNLAEEKLDKSAIKQKKQQAILNFVPDAVKTVTDIPGKVVNMFKGGRK